MKRNMQSSKPGSTDLSHKAMRLISVSAGVIVQLCLGGIYAFSAFVPSMNTEWGIPHSRTQLLFGLTVFLFTVVMIYTGRLLIRHGPRKMITASGLLFLAGYLLASFGKTNPWLLYTGYILFVSPALAAGYVSPIVSGILWYPNHRGLITGIAVAGYGAGGVIQTAVVELLLSRGLSLQTVMLRLGLIWGCVIIVSGLISFRPPGMPLTEAPKPNRLKIREIIQSSKRDFAAIAVLLGFGTIPGLMLIGAIKPIGLYWGLSPESASLGVAALAIGNGAGRIFWGFTADRLYPRFTAAVNLSAVLFSIILFACFPLLFIFSAFFLGFAYGGPLVIAPHQTARVYGSINVSAVYPAALTFHGAAALAGAPLSGLLYQYTGSFTSTFTAAGLFAGVGILSYLMLTRKK